MFEGMKWLDVLVLLLTHLVILWQKIRPDSKKK